jgi:hypothetical protein
VIKQIVQLTKCISVDGTNLLLYYKSIHFEVSTITITVSVEAEYTAIEVKGDNIKITKAEYIPVGTNVLTPLVKQS